MEDSWVMIEERSQCTDICSNSIVMLVSLRQDVQQVWTIKQETSSETQPDY